MNINLTENSFMYQSAKRLLEHELDKCLDLLKATENKWNEYMDLKLHDIGYGDTDCDFELNGATVHFDEEYLKNEFYVFCEMEYDVFIQDCELSGINFNDLRDNVGSTSKFYLGTMHNNYADKYIVALAEAVEDFNMSLLSFRMVDGKIRPVLDEDINYDIDDITNEMLSLTECLYDNLKYKLDDIVSVYDYIADFKENQVDNFKEFVKENWIENM